MKVSFYFVVLFFLQSINGQKTVQKTISNNKDTAIEVNVNNCYLVTIKTSKTNDIVVEAKMAGEYGNDLALNIHEEDKTLLIDTGFNANFQLPNDKLAAHKVLSIVLNISVPEDLKVTIYGTNCNVNTFGSFRDLNVSLFDGKCTLNSVGDKTSVYTQSGTIELFTEKAKIKAESSYGEVFSEEILEGNSNFNLKTITGNIHIYKTN